MKRRTAKDLERALGNAIINGPSYIPGRRGRPITDADRERCEQEHREALDRITEEYHQALERESGQAEEQG